MSTTKASADTKRRKTRYRGITYRERRDGTRTYSIYWRGKYVAVDGGEQDALAKQADLRGRAARGERAVTPTTATFADVAEQWFESKRRLRPWTRKAYRAALDKELIPRFGSKRLGAIATDDVAKLIRDLEGRGLATSTIESYVLPLSGTLTFAVRRGLVAVNPCSLLTRDDRPPKRERKQDHVWNDGEMAALIEAAAHLARQPESRYDYTPLLRTALFTGLRLGELLGLQWQDVDLEDGSLHVRRQYTRLAEYAAPKTTAALRRIPLSREMTECLGELKRQRALRRIPAAGDPVFAARNGQPLGHRNATRRGFEAAAKHAGIEGVSFHSMRHAFASRMIARGVEPVALAKVMGHEDARITLSRYTHLYDRQRTDDVIREAMSG